MLAFFIISAELVGIAGAFFTVNSIPTWYATLAKPAFAPPNWVFGPVWIILYALMGIAGYLIWRKIHGHRHSHFALRLYAFQLMFNFLWSLAFFGMRNIQLAFADIVVLLVLIIAVTITFFKIRKTAGWLFVPYLAWVAFATVLNAYLLFLN